MAENTSTAADEIAPVEYHDVPCPGCGCLCDDLRVTPDDANLPVVHPQCPLAEAYFREAPATAEDCRIDGRAATLQEGIAAAARLLREAHAPLLFGLGETTNETVRTILDLADSLEGIVDATHPTFFDPTGRVLQTTGLVTCSLGEIRHRADVVVYWGCDPLTTHPRHLERYSAHPTGRFIPQGRQGRYLLSIDRRPHATSDQCDAFLPLPPEKQIAALQYLAALAHDKHLPPSVIQQHLGPLAEALRQLYGRLRQARYFVLVLGERFLDPALGRVPLELLAHTVRALHEDTRGAISICRPGPNWIGAAGVVASRTGYPGGASLAGGSPQYDPENHQLARLLATGRVDAALYLAGAWQAGLANPVAQALAKLPKVVLGHRARDTQIENGIFLPISRPGWSGGGTMSRLDDLPLPVRALETAAVPDAQTVIEAILQNISDEP